MIDDEELLAAVRGQLAQRREALVPAQFVVSPSGGAVGNIPPEDGTTNFGFNAGDLRSSERRGRETRAER